MQSGHWAETDDRRTEFEDPPKSAEKIEKGEEQAVVAWPVTPVRAKLQRWPVGK